MNEKKEFLDYLNQRVEELSESPSEPSEIDSTAFTYSLDNNPSEQTENDYTASEGLLIDEDEVVTGEDETETQTSYTTETIEIISIEPDVLYEKLDNIQNGLSAVSLCSLIIIVYFVYEFIGKFLHIRKEGDL